MKCPHCKNSAMKVTHTYTAGTVGKTQRLECPLCQCVGTAVVLTVLVAKNPEKGQGAIVLARDLAKGKRRVSELVPVK